MATNVRDPRTIITPDAFEVSEALLGLPLANPAKRLWAIVIDLIVIGLITAMTSDLRLIIWGIVGLFFLQMAFRTPGRKMGKAAAVLFRGATGCLGMMIILGVGIGWLAIGFDADDIAEDAIRGFADGAGNVEVPDLPIPADEGGSAPSGQGLGALGGFAQGFVGLAAAAQIGQAENEDEARATIYDVLDAGYEGLKLRGDALRELGEGLVSDDAAFTDDPERFRAGVVDEWAAERGVDIDAPATSGSPTDPAPDATAGADTDATSSADGAADAEEIEKAVADLGAPAVLREWALRVEQGDTAASDVRAAAIRARALTLLAGDSLAALQRRSGRLEDQLADSREEVSALQTALDEGEAGVTGLLRDIWEQLGSAFGLWSIYFTVMLTLFKGRTVGKMVTRTRVVRLDGEPINWWAAFERCGGYFAGIATGLLGFAQVYWDPNRQCVHDKIVGTAVVLDGVEAIPGAWREAAGHGESADPS